MRSAAVFYSLIVLMLFFSCSDDSNKNNKEEIVDREVSSPVVYVTKNIREEDPGCDSSPEYCAKVVINFPEITNVPAALNKEELNSQIKKVILTGSLNPEGKVNDVAKACKIFLEDFASFKKAMQQDVVAWSIEINIDIINNDGDYFSIRINENAYMGGAHPNQFTSFLNYNSRTGEIVDLTKLVKKPERLQTLAEEEFRKIKNLSGADDIKEAGYFTEDGKFKVSDHFGISQGNLLLYYNNYEIAPYASGPTLLELPLEKIL